jgi:hypothetical protein
MLTDIELVGESELKVVTSDAHKYFFLLQQPSVGQGLLIHEVSRSHTTTHYSRQKSSGPGISLSQRPLPWQHNTHNRQTSMPPVETEPKISAGERPQTYALDCAATGTGSRRN